MDETFFQAKPGFRWRSEGTGLELLNFPAGCNMAFKRNALEKINYFDEKIDYGFDDLDPVERLGSTGFRIVLDPEVSVYHQHRSNLRDELKQHFNYGRGGAKLILAARERASKLARWVTTYLVFSTFTVCYLSFLVASGVLFNRWGPIQFSLNISSLVYTLLTTIYLETALRTRSLRKLVIYPILDIARGLFFTAGGVTQLFKESGRKARKNI